MLFPQVKCILSVLSFSRFAIAIMLGLVLGLPSVNCVLRQPEFAEPIKNVTLSAGSDVEFSCDVRYLGTYRVVWVLEKDDTQQFLTIGIVKVTPNPRFHITKLQKSDDVTQFNLYIYNIGKNDSGMFQCSVNSNPMISQIGTLEVTGDIEETRGRQQTRTSDTSQSPAFNENDEKYLTNSTIVPCADESDSNCSASSETNEELDKDNSTLEGKVFQNSTLFCVDLNDVWENARERISSFVSTLMKFTYSYWFS